MSVLIWSCNKQLLAHHATSGYLPIKGETYDAHESCPPPLRPQFGSGWAWLVTDKSGKLAVTKTPNAVLPVVEGKTPVLTCDVWEVSAVGEAKGKVWEGRGVPSSMKFTTDCGPFPPPSPPHTFPHLTASLLH